MVLTFSPAKGTVDIHSDGKQGGSIVSLGDGKYDIFCKKCSKDIRVKEDGTVDARFLPPLTERD